MTDISGLVLVSSDITVFGNKRIHTYSWQQPGTLTWPSGGVQCPATNFKLTKVDFVDFDGGDLLYSYDFVNSKVIAKLGTVSGTGMIDATPTVPNSGDWVRVRAQGTGLST